jgi:hypothetical protein
MWDANESIEDTAGEVRKLLRETKLVDTFTQIAGDPGDLPTYSRGRKCIDYIFTSRDLLPFISRVGYLAMFEANNSDHRGMFLDISECILDTKVILSRPTKRYIGSKSKADIIYKYKNYIHRQFIRHRIYDRAAELKRLSDKGPVTPELIRQINNLDKQITEIILAAEKSQCLHKQETDWSITIHQQLLLCKYWAKVYKRVKDRFDTSKQSMELFSQLSDTQQQAILQITSYHHPMKTRIECRKQLWLAMKYQKQLLTTHHELRRQDLLSF